MKAWRAITSPWSEVADVRKLLSAEIQHIFKSKLFWLEILFFAGFSAFIVMVNYSPSVQSSDNPIYLDDVFFTFYQLMALAFAICISMTVGTEYSDGVIRNKLIVGHTRRNIFFSILLLHMGVSLMMIVLHGIVSYGLGYLLFGGFRMEFSQLVYIVLCSALANLVFVALFVGISMNGSNKAVTVVVTMVLHIAILYLTGFIGARLSAGEMTYDGIQILADGTMQLGELIKNPNYVSGWSRTVCEWIYDIIPTGQILQMQSDQFVPCLYFPVLSTALLVLNTAVGYLLFSRKDIK